MANLEKMTAQYVDEGAYEKFIIGIVLPIVFAIMLDIQKFFCPSESTSVMLLPISNITLSSESFFTPHPLNRIETAIVRVNRGGYTPKNPATFGRHYSFYK